MRRFFTKHLFLMVLSFVAVDMMGQKLNSLVITGPANIAGNYTAVRASFGPKVIHQLLVMLLLSLMEVQKVLGHYCVRLTNTVTGKIAFVDRGGCAVAVNGELSSKALKLNKLEQLLLLFVTIRQIQRKPLFQVTTGTNATSNNTFSYDVLH